MEVPEDDMPDGSRVVVPNKEEYIVGISNKKGLGLENQFFSSETNKPLNK